MKPLCATAFFVLALSVSAQDTAKPASPQAAETTASKPISSAWIMRTYRFPSSELIEGFATKARGQLRAPRLPSVGAPQDEAVTLLRLSHEVVTAYLDTQGITLPKGTLLAFDPANSTLIARTTADGHDAINSLVPYMTERLPKHLVLTLELYETDTTAARQVLQTAASVADHQLAYQQLLALVATSKGKLLDSLRIETKGGQRAATERTLSYTYPTEFTLEERAAVATAMETMPVGLRWEIDPVVSPDGRTLDLTQSFTHDFAPPSPRYEPVGIASSVFYEAPVTDFHRVNVNTSFSLLSGTSQLVAVWRPAGEPKATNADVLDLAFITANVVPLIAASDPALLALLKAHGEATLPTPTTVPKVEPDPALPPGMVVRRFRVPSDFMTLIGTKEGSSGAAAADPFAAAPTSPKSETRMTVKLTVLDYLRSQGISFPLGSSANYDPSINEVIVRNTPENLGMVETFIEFPNDHVKTLGFELHLIEAPGAMLRQIESDTAALADHSSAWASLQKALADHTATAVSTQWLQTKGGQRATLIAGDERTYLTGSGGSSGTTTTTHDSGDKPETKNVQTVNNYLGNNDRWQFSPTFEIESVGTKMELESIISPDSLSIDLTCAITHHYAPPLLQHTPPTAIDKVSQAWTPTTSFNKAIVQTQTTLLEGKPRLLSAWKPTGTAAYDGKDVRQAIFIIPHIQRLEQPEAK